MGRKPFAFLVTYYAQAVSIRVRMETLVVLLALISTVAAPITTLYAAVTVSAARTAISVAIIHAMHVAIPNLK